MSFRFTARILLLATALCATAHARERVTLRNGFELECLHHASLDLAHIRLFMPGENNYQDIAADAIASIESVPDPPPPPPPAIASALALPALDLRELLAHAGLEHHIDLELLASIVHAESNGNTHAVSRTGARGLMQLMPGTARELGVEDPTRADQNIAGGAAYLDALLTRYHDNLAFALAAYNAGPGAVDRYHGIPPFRETRAYVMHVMAEFQRRAKASQAAAHAMALAGR